MMETLWSPITIDSLFTPILYSAVFIYFLAGIIKGMLGIGFPTAAVSLLAQVTDARTAISLVVIPMAKFSAKKSTVRLPSRAGWS